MRCSASTSDKSSGRRFAQQPLRARSTDLGMRPAAPPSCLDPAEGGGRLGLALSSRAVGSAIASALHTVAQSRHRPRAATRSRRRDGSTERRRRQPCQPLPASSSCSPRTPCPRARQPLRSAAAQYRQTPCARRDPLHGFCLGSAAVPLLSTLALPERAYAIVGQFALDDADIAALKHIVSGAEGWPACLRAWAAIGSGTPKPTSLSVTPSAGRRFAHILVDGALGRPRQPRWRSNSPRKMDLKSTSPRVAGGARAAQRRRPHRDGRAAAPARFGSRAGRSSRVSTRKSASHRTLCGPGAARRYHCRPDAVVERRSSSRRSASRAARARSASTPAPPICAQRRATCRPFAWAALARWHRAALVEADATRPAADRGVGRRRAFRPALWCSARTRGRAVRGRAPRDAPRRPRWRRRRRAAHGSEANLELLRGAGPSRSSTCAAPLADRAARLHARRRLRDRRGQRRDRAAAPQPVEVARFDREGTCRRGGWEVHARCRRGPPMVARRAAP